MRFLSGAASSEEGKCNDGNERGAAMPEFAIALPFLLLLITGLVNLGSMLWQVTLFSDATREGARIAANRSNFDGSCSNLRSDAVGAASEYMGNAGGEFENSWNGVEAIVVVTQWDGLVMDTIRVSTETDNSRDNCLICFGGLLDYIDVQLRSSFALERPCV